MTSKNKFGFAPLDADTTPKRRDRAPGPMGAAVREAAESLSETTEAKVEQRRQNADDAKAFRQAQSEGRVLIRLPLSEIATDDLPRDRMELEAVAHSDEMEELKTSIRERGQKEPIEVYIGPDGRTQLKKGWRRFTALSQLWKETGDVAFSEIMARMETGQGDRIARYLDMVEENVVREDLTFAEMAQVAITAAQDPSIGEVDPTDLIPRLYGALHKTKRSYIRSFVFMMSALGDALKWPKDVSRNLGVDVSRAIKSADQVEALKDKLARCETAEAQNEVLAAFASGENDAATKRASTHEPKQKFEFYVGQTKVTARKGECRIVSDKDFATLPKSVLEQAIKAFEDALNGGPKVR